MSYIVLSSYRQLRGGGTIHCGHGAPGCMAVWQGGDADTRCWLHVRARWPGVSRGRRGPGPASVQVLGVAGLCHQYEGYDVCQQQPSQTGP